jgi:hypothetical protein
MTQRPRFVAQLRGELFAGLESLQRRRRHRRAAVGVLGAAMVLGAGVLAYSSLTDDDDGADVITAAPDPPTTPAPLQDVVPSTTSLPGTTGPAPVEPDVVVWSDSGVRVRVDADLSQVTVDPATIAVFFAPDTVVYQRTDSSLPPVGVDVIGPNGSRVIEPETGRRLTLHDGGIVDGRPKLLVSSSVAMPVGPDDAESRLLVIDLESGQRTDLGRFGGWESAVTDGAFAAEAIVLLRSVEIQNWLEVVETDGSTRFRIDLTPDTSWSIAVDETGSTALVLRPGFEGAELTPTLSGFIVDIRTGEVIDEIDAALDLQGVQIEGGFCSNAAYSSGFLLCDQSVGPPLRIDPARDWLTQPIDGIEDGAVSPAVAPFSPETATPDAADEILTVEEDGWYPWLTPTPTLASFEEGCRSPESVAKGFVYSVARQPGAPRAANSFPFIEDGEPDVPLLVLSQSSTRIEFLALSRGGDGVVLETGTVVTMARIDPGVVECEAWGVLSATAPDDVTIDSPRTGSEVGAEILVTGTGRGFEANIGLRVLDEFMQPLGDSSAHGGWEVEPYSGAATIGRAPFGPNMTVIALSDTALDGATRPFAAVKVRYDGSPVNFDGFPAPVASVAVIGVDVGDVLNARSAPGISSDLFATFSPFQISLTEFDDEAFVGPDRWVLVGDPNSRDLDAWVNAEFLTRIEGDSDQPDALYQAATSIREALSLNSPTDRLADAIGTGAFTVSADGFFDESDPTISLDDLVQAGSTQDVARPWGVDRESGDPVTATIADFFAELGKSPALTVTERISVNEPIAAGGGNARENFPDATIIELYNGGDQDTVSSSIQLVFQPRENFWQLVGIALSG